MPSSPRTNRTTPTAWLNRQRLILAQQLLEETDATLDLIAVQTGFGAAAVMRHHFVRSLQTTPTAYRRTFGRRRPVPASGDGAFGDPDYGVVARKTSPEPANVSVASSGVM